MEIALWILAIAVVVFLAIRLLLRVMFPPDAR